MNKYYEKHQNHQIDIIEGPFEFGYNGKSGFSTLMKQIHPESNAVTHPGKIVCKTCNKYIKWASRIEIDSYKNVHRPNMTFGEYMKRTNDYLHSISEHDPANIFLTATFKDKDIVKKYGATWDPYHKLWYTTIRRQHAEKLIPWMMPDDVNKLRIHLKK
jgi:hypothetical protein